MCKQSRLRHRKEFDAVFRQGCIWANDLLVLRSLLNHLDHNRYGFVTSKRLGRAVVRNRVRRRLREALRALPLLAGWDIVISARASAGRSDFHDLKKAVAKLLDRAGVLSRDLSPGETPS